MHIDRAIALQYIRHPYLQMLHTHTIHIGIADVHIERLLILPIVPVESHEMTGGVVAELFDHEVVVVKIKDDFLILQQFSTE